MIDTVKVHYQTKRVSQPIKSSKETSDVSKVVKDVIYDTLN